MHPPMSEKMAGKQPVRPPNPEKVAQELSVKLNALEEMLSDPNTSPGPQTTELIRKLASAQRDENDSPSKTNAEERRLYANTFLSRDYHAQNASRFLFSCADENDGYAKNKAKGWLYTLPEAPVAAGSTNNEATVK